MLTYRKHNSIDVAQFYSGEDSVPDFLEKVVLPKCWRYSRMLLQLADRLARHSAPGSADAALVDRVKQEVMDVRGKIPSDVQKMAGKRVRDDHAQEEEKMKDAPRRYKKQKAQEKSKKEGGEEAKRALAMLEAAKKALPQRTVDESTGHAPATAATDDVGQ